MLNGNKENEYRHRPEYIWNLLCCLKEAGETGENHRPWTATGQLYYVRLRVECTLFVIHKAGREHTPYWVIGLYELLGIPTT